MKYFTNIHTLDELKAAIAEALRSADAWDMDLARELCALAGMADAFDAADGETFEPVIYSAADKLGVEVI